MPTPHHLGRHGETLAARHLERRGWTLLARNYRLGRREIDIVARHGDLVAFIEVKTRASKKFGHPLASITRRKRAEIERVAHAWVARHGRPSDVYRFDAIAIRWECDEKPVIEHVEDAWRMD